MPTDLPPGKPSPAPAQEMPDRTAIVLNWMALFVAIGLCFWVVSALSFKGMLDTSAPPAISLPVGEQ